MAKVVGSVQTDVRRQEVFEMGKTIAESLREEGREEGRQQEEVRSGRRLLVRLLRNKFGKIPAATLKRIEATDRLDLLDAWFDQAVDAKKLDEVSFTDLGGRPVGQRRRRHPPLTNA